MKSNPKECEPKNEKEEGQSVHEHKDGTWWFWDENWSVEYGPYAAYPLACHAMARYASNL